MILAVLQARVSSSRLPGKVLKPLLGVPMLIRQVERVKHSELIDYLIIATSSESSDDEIAELCHSHDIGCFRGSLNDVLDRFYQAARPFNSRHIVRLTGDCPVIDPALIDKVLSMHIKGKFDYTSNSQERTFPDGLDVEVFTFDCLKTAWENAFLPSHREHVTPYMCQQPGRFNIGVLKNDQDLSHLRWTVDEMLDYILIEKIYEALYPGNPCFQTTDILDFLNRNPELMNINSAYECNEGMKKSLLEDQIYLQRKTMAKELE